jgi:hypothetical protein
MMKKFWCEMYKSFKCYGREHEQVALFEHAKNTLYENL